MTKTYLTVEDVVVGQRVGYVRYHHWGGAPLVKGFGTVMSIHKGWGHITVETEQHGRKVFDKHGRVRRGYGFGSHLIDPTALEQQLEDIERQRQLNKACRALIQFLEDRRNGHGDFINLGEGERRSEFQAHVNEVLETSKPKE